MNRLAWTMDEVADALAGNGRGPLPRGSSEFSAVRPTRGRSLPARSSSPFAVRTTTRTTILPTPSHGARPDWSSPTGRARQGWLSRSTLSTTPSTR